MKNEIDTSLLQSIRIGMTREEVVGALGVPDAMGGTSRKHRTPAIYRYGKFEFHFECHREGRLVTVYTEDEEGYGIVLLGEVGPPLGPHVTIVQDTESLHWWEGLYVDGQLKKQACYLTVDDILKHLEIHNERVELDSDNWDEDEFPADLSELPLKR